jgi:hypothetical protein
MGRKRVLLLLALVAGSFPIRAEEPKNTGTSPVFIAELPNPNDFTLFANGGWDGNWYVGFNNCWMQKLPAPPEGNYKKAFVGARLGRMKNHTPPGKQPWEKEAFAGDIYIAVSDTPSWKRNDSFFLTTTKDIPFEPDPLNAVESTGDSRWFWVEVPVQKLNMKGDNFIAIWSPTPALTSVSSAPILAAGWGNKDANSWVSQEVKGMPPSSPSKALSTPITVFEPALALKLIPDNPAHSAPKVSITQIAERKARGKMPAPKAVWSEVEGQSVERAWIELSTDNAKWNRYGKYVWNAPFVFSIKSEEIPIGPGGKTWVRVGAADTFEAISFSDPIDIFQQ